MEIILLQDVDKLGLKGEVVDVKRGYARNYLLPRDCPRVTYFAGRETAAADVERFLGSSPAVIAVEPRFQIAQVVAKSSTRAPSGKVSSCEG